MTKRNPFSKLTRDFDAERRRRIDQSKEKISAEQAGPASSV